MKCEAALSKKYNDRPTNVLPDSTPHVQRTRLLGSKITYSVRQSTMLKALTIVFTEGLEESDSFHKLLFACLRLLRALRILCFRDAVFEYQRLNIFTKLCSRKKKKLDPFYFLIHNFYVCRGLNLRQRLRCAMAHHEYERTNYSSEYVRQVYACDGILLWENTIDSMCFALRLVATEDNLHEGELSVVLTVNNNRLCRMSFCYLDAEVFGVRPHLAMLISRNQADRTFARKIFDKLVKQTMPQLLCLYGICGIAMSNGFNNVLAIKHDSQIAYDKNYDSSFRNSYTRLWEKFGAVDLDGRAYLLDVPLKLNSLSSVNRSHRSRAQYRRRNWDEIAECARSALDSYRVGPSTGVAYADRHPAQRAAGLGP